MEQLEVTIVCYGCSLWGLKPTLSWASQSNRQDCPGEEEEILEEDPDEQPEPTVEQPTVEQPTVEQPSNEGKETTVEKTAEKRKRSKYAAVNETNDFIRAIVERCNSQKYLSTPKERTCVHKVCRTADFLLNVRLGEMGNLIGYKITNLALLPNALHDSKGWVPDDQARCPVLKADGSGELPKNMPLVRAVQCKNPQR
eukprot:684172-Prorocentrum_minimum.AAC.3